VTTTETWQSSSVSGCPQLGQDVVDRRSNTALDGPDLLRGKGIGPSSGELPSKKYTAVSINLTTSRRCWQQERPRPRSSQH
jgi:hypothetical protein